VRSKAVVLDKIGGGLRVEEVEVEEPGEGEVIVRVEASGVCYRDLLVREGFYPRAKPPLVLGHEFAGVVEKVGERVELKAGDKVAGLLYAPCGECEYCRSGREYLCRRRLFYGEELRGSYSEYVKAYATSLVELPNGVSPADASFAGCVLASLTRLFDEAGVRRGDRVVVTGAGGGVGVHAVQLARAYGAEVIAITRSEEKAERLREFADHVVVGLKFAEEVKRVTGGGADYVVEIVGSPTMEQSIRSLSWGGKILLYGNVDPRTPASIPLGLLIMKDVSIISAGGGGRLHLRKALELIARGGIKPIYTTMPLEEAERAHDVIKSGRNFGKIVLKP